MTFIFLGASVSIFGMAEPLRDAARFLPQVQPILARLFTTMTMPRVMIQASSFVI